VDTNSYINKK